MIALWLEKIGAQGLETQIQLDELYIIYQLGIKIGWKDSVITRDELLCVRYRGNPIVELWLDDFITGSGRREFDGGDDHGFSGGNQRESKVDEPSFVTG